MYDGAVCEGTKEYKFWLEYLDRKGSLRGLDVVVVLLRGRADKSLGRPGRKQATETKHGFIQLLVTKLNTLLSPLF